jgi:peptidoglycan/LPS O-acetylase OafA/YrhL
MRVTQLASRSGDGQAPRESSSITRFYLPELDSLRFFAFLAVFVWHVNPIPGWAIAAPHKNFIETLAIAVWQAGEFGVDLFFTLSAFLITELLMREKLQFGSIDIRSFYVRRILRIWPLYFGFLAALFLALAILPGAIVPWLALPGFVVFLGNFAMYRGVFVPLPLGILWSVSLEEQFYLLWPWVVSHVSRKGLLVVAIFMWLFSISFRWRLIVDGVPPRVIWWNSFARLDPLACGVLLSVLLDGSKLHRFRNARRTIAIAAVSLIVAAGYCSPREDSAAAFRIMLAYPLGALGCCGVVLAALGMGDRPDSWIVNPVLKYLGRISYGLYVFHASMILLALKLLRGLEPHPVAYRAMVAALALTLTIGVAAASYQWLEKPFLKLKTRFQRVRSMPL